MFVSDGIKWLLLSLLVSNVQSSFLMRRETDTADLLEQNVESYKHLVSNLKGGVENLYIGDILTDVANAIAQLNYKFGDQQQKAFDDIVKINKDSLHAINSARVVVTKLKSITSLAVYALNLQQSEEMYTAAVQVFLTSSTEVTPEVKIAIGRIIDVIADSSTVAGSFTVLITWVEKKKSDFQTLSAKEQEEERRKAYGGAAACLVWGPLAVFACPISYGIAAGVTEGKTVKDIEKSFEAGIEKINEMKSHIDKLKTKTNGLIDLVKRDYKKLVGIQTQLTNSKSAANAIKISFKIFFTPFKNSVTTLDEECQKYLDLYTPKRELN